MRITKFEDLQCWQAARILVNSVYDVSTKNNFVRDFGLRDQIQRASVSVMANISEGFGSGTTKELIRFLNFSIRSTFEVQSHLYIALDRKYLDSAEFNRVYNNAKDCINLCKGFVRYLKQNNKLAS